MLHSIRYTLGMSGSNNKGIVFIALFVLVVGGLFMLNNTGEAPSPAPTPTPVPSPRTQSVSPEPSVTQDPAQITPGDVSGESAITLEEIALHATQSDCWMAINGNVYDVTDFISSHPGGQAIVFGCGKDATSFFENRANNKGPHSEMARSLLPQFLIGELAE